MWARSFFMSPLSLPMVDGWLLRIWHSALGHTSYLNGGGWEAHGIQEASSGWLPTRCRVVLPAYVEGTPFLALRCCAMLVPNSALPTLISRTLSGVESSSYHCVCKEVREKAKQGAGTREWESGCCEVTLESWQKERLHVSQVSTFPVHVLLCHLTPSWLHLANTKSNFKMSRAEH